MSITRKMLKGMGLTEDQQDTILEAHTETVDEIKAERNRYKSAAENLPNIQRQLEEAQEVLKTAQQDGWKEKHDKVKRELDDYRAQIEGEKAHAAKEKAVKAYLESKNIIDGNLTIAMRGLGAEIDAAELDGEKLKDTKAFDDLIAGDLKGLVTTTKEKGAPPPANPPKNIGGSMTKDEIFKISDRAERRAAIAANMNLFEKGD